MGDIQRWAASLRPHPMAASDCGMVAYLRQEGAGNAVLFTDHERAVEQARAEGFAAGLEKAREVVEEERTAEFSLPSGYNLALDDVLAALSGLPGHPEGEKE